jgi:hypothetical protein
VLKRQARYRLLHGAFWVLLPYGPHPSSEKERCSVMVTCHSVFQVCGRSLRRRFYADGFHQIVGHAAGTIAFHPHV